MVEYKSHNVIDAARQRISFVFDQFARIVVSISGGKDSSVLRYLALAEAEKRSRKIELLFIDQEAEWQSSIDLMEQLMVHPLVIPMWYQVPILMTNATSHKDVFLDAWWEGREWIRPKNKIAIHSIHDDYPRRFHELFHWLENSQTEKTAFLIGLRSKESLTRFRAVTKSPGYQAISWSTQTKNPMAFRFYPIYDWTFGDIWKAIDDFKIQHNRVYERLFWKYGANMSRMRVSNLIHEKAFRALADVQEFEPETYEHLLRRLQGVHCAALYAQESFIYSVDKRPAVFPTWLAYRDYLLASTPSERSFRFVKRFSGQPVNEAIHREQCKQILLNDWENNLPVRSNSAAKLRRIWYHRL